MLRFSWAKYRVASREPDSMSAISIDRTGYRAMAAAETPVPRPSTKTSLGSGWASIGRWPRRSWFAMSPGSVEASVFPFER